MTQVRMKLPRLNLCLPALLLALSPWLRSTAGPVPSMAIGMNFEGSISGVATPADPNGVIGPGYFVEFINGSFSVYNKTNGQSVKHTSDVTFWTRAGVFLSSSDGVADPRIVYDPTVQRWFASMVDFDASAPGDPSLYSNDFLLAVSATSDPRGTWHAFLFQADPDNGSFADFPTLGVDANAVYISGDMYQGESNPLGAALWSIPKADLIAASPSIANATWHGVMAYSERGNVLQPVNCFDASANGKVLAVTDIGLDTDPHSNIVSFAVQNAGSPSASLTV